MGCVASFAALCACGGDDAPSEADAATADAAVEADATATDGATSTDAEADGDADAAENEDAAVLTGPVRQLSVAEQPANRLARWIDYRTDDDVLTDVEVQCGDAYEQRFVGSDQGTSHEVLVLGLPAGEECRARIYVDGEVGADERFDVRAPEGWPEFEVVVSQADAVQPGWTLFNLANAYDSVPARVVLVDPEGRLRWYYELPITASGADTEVRVTSEGVLACGRLGTAGPFLVSWDGPLLWQPRLGGHHDCGFRDADEEVFWFIADGHRCEDGPGSDIIVEVDRETGDTLWDWAICEHHTPADLVPDWSHLNAVDYFPGENTFVTSSRTQHALFKVDMDTGDVVWKLGLDGDFAHDPEDAFFRQHAPEIQDDGHILLFDNGRERNEPQRRSSRVIEIAYDETEMTYEVVWEFAPTPTRFNPIWGDADRLDNGNTLSTFGARSTTETTDLYEVDADAEIVWQLRLPPRWGAYRADRIEPQFGHVVE